MFKAIIFFSSFHEGDVDDNKAWKTEVVVAETPTETDGAQHSFDYSHSFGN